MEINGKPRCKWPEADVLILAGDVWNGWRLRSVANDANSRKHKKNAQYLIDKVFPKYKLVLAVMGNHEHYGSYLSQTEEFIRDFHKDCPNFKLLHGEKYVFENVVFIGATLWTNYMRGNQLEMTICQQFMNDYRCIGRIDDKPITPLDIIQVHYNELDLMDCLMDINVFGDQKIVFITHHPPTLKSLASAHVGNGLDAAFASDLSSFIEEHPQISMWFHGHTHENFDYMCFNTRVLANQCGYNHEVSYRNFKVQRVYLDVQDPESSDRDIS
jgi:Icc-related predicted phosphoesterase